MHFADSDYHAKRGNLEQIVFGLKQSKKRSREESTMSAIQQACFTELESRFNYAGKV